MGKVSIIIPIYGVREYIADSLKSVLNQTYNDIEVVLVNDCTPDDSMEVAQEMISQLKERFEVVVVNHEENKGISDTRNNGVKIATGEYIFFLDSDDEITPDCIELLHNEFVKNPDISFSYGGFMEISIDGARNEFIPDVSTSSTKEMFDSLFSRKLTYMSWNRLVRKEFLVANDLWFESNMVYEDILFTIQFILASSSCSHVPQVTYLYKLRGGSLTKSSVTMQVHTSHFRITKWLVSLVDDDSKISKIQKDRFVYEQISNGIVSAVLDNTIFDKKEKRERVEYYLKLYRDSNPNLKLIIFDNKYFGFVDKIRICILKFTPIKLGYFTLNAKIFIELCLKSVIRFLRPRNM